MEKPTKKQYVRPTLKEQGVVRELTQKSGSGGQGPSTKKDNGSGPWNNPIKKYP
jgi:hypothetical protein